MSRGEISNEQQCELCVDMRRLRKLAGFDDKVRSRYSARRVRSRSEILLINIAKSTRTEFGYVSRSGQVTDGC
jgi:hypothetical protein